MRKRVIGLVLAVVLCLGLTVPAMATASERFVIIEAQARISLSEQPISYDRSEGLFTVRAGSSVILDVPLGRPESTSVGRSNSNFTTRTNIVVLSATADNEAVFTFAAPGFYIVATLVGGMDFWITVVDAPAPPPQPEGIPDELSDGVAIHPQYRFPNLVGDVDIGEWLDWVIIPDPNHPRPAPVYPRNFHALFLNGVPLRQGRNYDFYIEDGSTRIVVRRQTVSNNANEGQNTITAEFRVGGEVYRATQTFTYTAPAAGGHSDWAVPYLARAEQLGIIPSTLRGENVDMRRPITRAEFAGVVVLAFETLSERQTQPAASNRFADTQDNYVLRAYNTELMVGVSLPGVSPATFAPNANLTREQAATALTRVFKSATIPGWTLATDDEYPLTFTWPELFADDANISDWARESVYFMAYNGIVLGTGNNMFSPRAVTTAQEAVGYASATREAAIVIALRMLENLG